MEILTIASGHSVKQSPSDTYTVIVVCTSVGGFLLLAVIHVWQMTVIYSCMSFYEDMHILSHGSTPLLPTDATDSIKPQLSFDSLAASRSNAVLETSN
ncbi:unnamed protein product [Anisakis simplex]|uniref:Transmembrane protein n=1 Tax=Anisakis simplex TaxID=6269 RepID=A0A0M3K6W1_ANISI|nr:unnamed protein product [Anisakis simplex]